MSVECRVEILGRETSLTAEREKEREDQMASQYLNDTQGALGDSEKDLQARRSIMVRNRGGRCLPEKVYRPYISVKTLYPDACYADSGGDIAVQCEPSVLFNRNIICVRHL